MKLVSGGSKNICYFPDTLLCCGGGLRLRYPAGKTITFTQVGAAHSFSYFLYDFLKVPNLVSLGPQLKAFSRNKGDSTSEIAAKRDEICLPPSGNLSGFKPSIL